jgi:phage-related protein
MTTVLIDGTDLGATFGWYVDTAPQWLDSTVRQVQTTPILNRFGLAPTGYIFGPRELQLTGTMRGTSLQALRDTEHQIRDLLASNVLTIQVNDGSTPARAVKGSLRTLAIAPLVPSLSGLAVRITASFICYDSTWQAVEPTIRHLTAVDTRYDLATGTAPSTPFIEIMGAATNPKLKYRDAAGQIQAELDFTITLAANTDTLIVDCGKGRVYAYQSSVYGPNLATITVGQDAFPFAIEPADGNYTLGIAPTIEITAGTGRVIYFKRWV